MKIIEKIEIKHFRSFDGGKDQEKVRIENLQDLNIFSGSNDSGKSNVLRALNLFFNGEISRGVKFDINRDFSKIVANRFDQDIKERKEKEKNRIEKLKKSGEEEDLKDLRRSDVVVSIKVHFNNYERKRGLEKKFWISKSFSKKNDFKGEYIYQGKIKGAQATQFIDSFQFEYVPAIKDRVFFNYLFGKLQNYLFEKEDKKKKNKFKQSSDGFNQILKDETGGLFEKFLASSGVEASFNIPSTLVDFFRTLSVKTENDISLFDRGDGVQARFIPEILDEISKNSSKNIIWGFEEPENSYEARNIRKLRDEFLKKYSRKKQIFITTHTKEFLSLKREITDAEKKIRENKKLKTQIKKDEALRELKLKDISSDVSIYRVWKNKKTNDTSLVTRFDENNNEWEKTCDDLGIVQESRIIESLARQVRLQQNIIDKSGLQKEKKVEVIKILTKRLKSKIQNEESLKKEIEEFKKPLIFFEDEYLQIYKIAFLKRHGIDCNENNFLKQFEEKSPFLVYSKNCQNELNKFLDLVNVSEWEGKKILGIFDFDSAYNQFNGLNKIRWSVIKDNEKTGLYRKRKDHSNFYAMVLPVPEHRKLHANKISAGNSALEIELYFPDDILKKLGCLGTKPLAGVSEKRKIFIGNKSNFWKKLFDLPKEDFKNFEPLFAKIAKLFKD